MKLESVQMVDIDVGDRFRVDYGDLRELIDSIKENELINPIAIYSETGDPPFVLAAGGRRFAAFVQMGQGEIPCRIYDHKLSELELRSIELEENIRRKELTFDEDVRLKREVHRLQLEIHGEKISRSPNASGHSMRDTAKLLGQKSHATLSQDIKLADTMDAFPEAGWDSCKTKAEAHKIVNRIEEKIIRRELINRAKETHGDVTRDKLINAYYVGDFFDHVKKLPDGIFDLVEIDPPYGIDLPNQKLQSGGISGGDKFAISYGSSYNEIHKDQYEAFITLALKELYRVMNNHSWLICWFGPDPWFEPVYQAIIAAGFKTRRLCGIWTKPGGQTHQPDKYLASSYEMFFYARKGDASITMEKRGRSNEFKFSPTHPSKKIHPTERPIELMKELLSVFATEGSRIYVPFCGSGITLNAAQELAMYPIGCDLGQDYKDGYVARILTKKGE
uniref:Putative methyltransferase n=1 Tax=viral metagenome TaxID=1070528 RepID=A0A6H1ZW12_9ZZZZ